MKTYIFFNPLSKSGETVKNINKIAKEIRRDTKDINLVNLLEVNDVDQILESIGLESEIIITGGDGTLHHLVNTIQGKNITRPILYYSAGTGNDFYRSIKKNSKSKLINITPYLFELPSYAINGEPRKFLNGCGIGFDALVAHNVNQSIADKKGSKFFKNTLKSFVNYQKIKNAQINIDGKIENHKNLWFCAVMNDKYQGGGMKFAPKANRQSSDLYVVYVKRLPKLIMPIILPSVFLGFHKIFFTSIKIRKVVDYIEVKIDGVAYFQADGETRFPVNNFIVRTTKNSRSE